MHQRYVALLHLARGKLLPQVAVGDVVAGDEDQPAGLLVEAMHDAGARLAADLRKLGEAVQQRVNQRAAIAIVVGRARAGVHHHAGRLIDDGEVVVFVDDVERNIFGHGAQRRRRGVAHDGDGFAAFELERCFRWLAIDQRLLFLQQQLYAGATGVGDLRDEVLVEALASSVSGNGDGDGEGGVGH